MVEMETANVFIRDPVGLRAKLKAFIEGGAEQMQVCVLKFLRPCYTIINSSFVVLQCITDFDGTLTRGSYKGEKAQSSFGTITDHFICEFSALDSCLSQLILIN